MAKQKQKRTYFTKSELVSFGNYLLSEERENGLVHKFNKRSVNDADLENWRVENELHKK